jgi:hypothetical protein
MKLEKLAQVVRSINGVDSTTLLFAAVNTKNKPNQNMNELDLKSGRATSFSPDEIITLP